MGNMLRLCPLYIILAIFFISCTGNNIMMGPGKWQLVRIERCEEDNLYDTKVDIKTYRLNRTHVAFDFKIHLAKDLNEEIAVRVDICKYVDGGCKPYQVLADESTIHFCEKYAKNNVEMAFQMASLGGWPVEKGDYEINEYVFNMDELPIKSMYGEFEAKGYLIKDGAEFSCVKVSFEFVECDDEDECGD